MLVHIDVTIGDHYLLAAGCTCVHELEAALEALPVNLDHVREALRVLQYRVGVLYTRVYTQQLNITPCTAASPASVSRRGTMFSVGAGEGRQCVEAWSPPPGPHLATRVSRPHVYQATRVPRPHVCRAHIKYRSGLGEVTHLLLISGCGGDQVTSASGQASHATTHRRDTGGHGSKLI